MTSADLISLLVGILIALPAYRLLARKLRGHTSFDLLLVGGFLAWALWTLAKLAISSSLWRR